MTAYAISIEDALAIAIQIDQGVDNADIVLGYPAFLGVSLLAPTAPRPSPASSRAPPPRPPA